MVVGGVKAYPSLRSVAKFDRTNSHMGKEKYPVEFYYQQSRILVNARKSELANWNRNIIV